MQNNFSVNENINLLFEKLESFLKTKTVVGEPIKISENTTIIPFVNISFGLGSGGGDGVDERGSKGIGGGAGTGGRIAPTAVLVVTGDKYELLPIHKSGGLDKLVEMVPEVLDKLKGEKCCE